MNINKDKARNAIYSAAGVYMLYTAWMLYGDLDEADGDGTLFLIFTIIFAIAGVALIGLGVWNLYKENSKTAGKSEAPGDGASVEEKAEVESMAETSADTEVSMEAETGEVRRPE